MEVICYYYYQEFENSDLESHINLEINLSYCYNKREEEFSDIDAKNISLKLEKCTNLEYLRLILNSLRIDSQLGFNLSSGFKNCKNLQSLELSIDRKRGKNLVEQNLGAFLENCSHLQELEINASCGDFFGESALDLFSGLGKCLNLNSLVLKLFKNQLGDQECFKLASAIHNLQNLTSMELHLGMNEISNEGFRNLGEAIQNCKNLVSLNIKMSSSQLNEEKPFNYLLERIKYCQNLQTFIFDASYCDFHVDIIRRLGTLFQQCQVLKVNLSHNNFLNEEPDIIELHQGENLLELDLDLSFSGLCSRDLEDLIKKISKNCFNLTDLRLCFNDIRIHAEDFESICSSLAKFQNLQSLDLELKESTLEDDCLQHFNSIFSLCAKLDKISLDLTKNQVNDLGAQNIGLAIKNLSKLSYLDLSFDANQFTLDGECSFLSQIRKNEKIAIFKYFSCLENEEDQIFIIRNILKMNKLVIKQFQ
ncbi:hypothetical protein ABPG74_017592 [Tetrahymena malaccensis]